MKFYTKKRKKIQIFSNGCLIFNKSNLLKINDLINFYNNKLIFFKKSKKLLTSLNNYEKLTYKKKFFK